MKKPDADYLRFRPYRAFTGQPAVPSRSRYAKRLGLALMILALSAIAVFLVAVLK